MTEQRLEKIETKLAFQEDLLEELNKTVYQQQQKLELLETICEALARQISAQAEAGNQGNTAIERPPHY